MAQGGEHGPAGPKGLQDPRPVKRAYLHAKGRRLGMVTQVAGPRGRPRVHPDSETGPVPQRAAGWAGYTGFPAPWAGNVGPVASEVWFLLVTTRPLSGASWFLVDHLTSARHPLLITVEMNHLALARARWFPTTFITGA